MPTIGIYTNLIKLTKLFFHEANAAVNINTCPSNNSKIEQRVREGCPLAPYLFLIIGELLSLTVKRAMINQEVKGVMLPRGGVKKNNSSIRRRHVFHCMRK